MNRSTHVKLAAIIGLVLPILVIGAALDRSALAAEKTRDIRSLMTPEDFSASGLEKLSEAERAHLSEWLDDYRQDALLGPAPPKTPEQRARAREITIEANVVPEFAGWSGTTVFRLDNGQVWKQRLPGKLRYRGEDSAVVIRQNLLGFYELVHTETGRIIGVKRIK